MSSQLNLEMKEDLEKWSRPPDFIYRTERAAQSPQFLRGFLLCAERSVRIVPGGTIEHSDSYYQTNAESVKKVCEEALELLRRNADELPLGYEYANGMSITYGQLKTRLANDNQFTRIWLLSLSWSVEPGWTIEELVLRNG